MKTNMDKRLHLGCGNVYLRDWTNIDLEIPGYSYKASKRPDLVEINGTSLGGYYKVDVTKDQFMSGNLHKKQAVCDMFADIKNLPFEDETIEAILLVQVFEHFTFFEGKKLIQKWYDLLKPGGYIQIDVPDMDGIVQEYIRCENQLDKDWYIRQIYGSQKNDFSIHKSGYTYESLSKLMIEVGFKLVVRLPNIHNYPAFAVKGYK